MTNERMRRTMEFIVQQQAKFAASIQRHEEERIRDQPRLASLEKSFQKVVELLAIQESRLDTSEARLAKSEARLTKSEARLAMSESRLDRVEFDSEGAERRAKAIEVNMAALAAAQAHADERLSALINMVKEDRGRSS